MAITSDKVIKRSALVTGLLVDITMAVICFASQTPDTFAKIAFVAVGVMIVLLIGATLAEKYTKLWLACVVVMFFFDTSYFLASTDPDFSTPLTIETDAELKRLTSEVVEAKKNAAMAQQTYNDALANPAISKATQSDINQQLIAANAKQTAKEAAETARRDAVLKGEIRSIPITADMIFYAIPVALSKLRILQTLIYMLISGIIQGMIWFGLQPPKGKHETILDSTGDDDCNGAIPGVHPGSSSDAVPAITRRKYLAACWPPSERRIHTAAHVAKSKGWQLADCEKAEAELFKSFPLEADGAKLQLQPDIDRDQFLRRRRQIK